MVDERDLFIQSDLALKHVVEQIRDDQWNMIMPPNAAVSDADASVTLRSVVNNLAYDDAWVPDMLAGKTMEEAGATSFDGDLLGDDPKGAFAAIAARATAAARDLDDLDRTVHCSFGDYPAREYLWQITSYRGLSAYDIAKAIGVDARLPDSLVQGLWEQLTPVAEEWRAIGIFGPSIDVPESADLQSRLLGLTGRQP